MDSHNDRDDIKKLRQLYDKLSYDELVSVIDSVIDSNINNTNYHISQDELEALIAISNKYKKDNILRAARIYQHYGGKTKTKSSPTKKTSSPTKSTSSPTKSTSSPQATKSTSSPTKSTIHSIN